jgi:hypothetical protein
VAEPDGLDLVEREFAEPPAHTVGRTELCHVTRVAGDGFVDPQRSSALSAPRAPTAVSCSGSTSQAIASESSGSLTTSGTLVGGCPGEQRRADGILTLGASP